MNSISLSNLPFCLQVLMLLGEADAATSLWWNHYHPDGTTCSRSTPETLKKTLQEINRHKKLKTGATRNRHLFLLLRINWVWKTQSYPLQTPSPTQDAQALLFKYRCSLKRSSQTYKNREKLKTKKIQPLLYSRNPFLFQHMHATRHSQSPGSMQIGSIRLRILYPAPICHAPHQ